MASLKKSHRRSGLATVEAALILPVLLLLTFGLIEYGWLFFKQEQITNATRQGARIAATPDATNAKVQGAIATLMNDSGLGSSGYSVTLTPSDITQATPGQLLTIQISVPYANVDLTHATTVPVPTTLSSSVSMAKEGP